MNLFKTTWRNGNEKRAIQALQKIKNPDELAVVLKESYRRNVSIAALEMVSDDDITLAHTVGENRFQEVRDRAFERIMAMDVPEEWFYIIAYSSGDREHALAALERIHDAGRLEKLCRVAAFRDVQIAASERVLPPLFEGREGNEIFEIIQDRHFGKMAEMLIKHKKDADIARKCLDAIFEQKYKGHLLTIPALKVLGDPAYSDKFLPWNPRVGEEAIETLSLELLEEYLYNTDPQHKWWRGRAVDILFKAGRLSADELAELLKSPDPCIRDHACNCLVKAGDRRAVPHCSIFDLAKLPYRESVDRLVAEIELHQDYHAAEIIHQLYKTEMKEYILSKPLKSLERGHYDDADYDGNYHSDEPAISFDFFPDTGRIFK